MPVLNAIVLLAEASPRLLLALICKIPPLIAVWPV